MVTITTYIFLICFDYNGKPVKQKAIFMFIIVKNAKKTHKDKQNFELKKFKVCGH